MLKINQDVRIKAVFAEYEKRNIIRNLSEATLNHHRGYFNVFMKFIEDDSFLITDLTKTVIDDFIIYQKQKGIKGISINTSLRSIRAFVNYCIEMDHIQPMKLPMVKQEESLKEVYTREDLERLLKKPNLKTSSFGIWEHRKLCVNQFSYMDNN